MRTLRPIAAVFPAAVGAVAAAARLTMRPTTLAVVIAIGQGCHSSPHESEPRDAGEGGTTIQVAVPRPVAPASASFSTSRKPTFRWQLGEKSDGARVDVCADRACTKVLTSFDVHGTSGAPPSELPPGVVFWRLHGLSGSLAGSSTGPTWEITLPARSAPVATVWGAMIDGNGDGFADVVVGDTDHLTASQHVYVYPGSMAGPATVPASILSAPMPSIRYAASVASGGDVNGDGFPDLLVGSPHEDKVYVYSGGPAGYAEPPAIALVGTSMTSFGSAVSAAGDVDGDGYGDIVVGAPSPAEGDAAAMEGQATVFFGGPNGLTQARSVALPSVNDPNVLGVGQYVASAGDMNGDGLADVAVYEGLSAKSDPQLLFLYLGSASGFGSQAPVTLQYQGASVTWLGPANLLACAGDVNGDGYADLVMATPAPTTGSYETDHLSLFFGGPTGPVPVPSIRIDSTLAAGDHFGMSVATADFDLDGVSDLAVAAVGFEHPAPAVQLFGGNAVEPALSATITTTDAMALTEREATGQDIDGDGYADLVIGYPGRQTATTLGDGGLLRGAVEVHMGGPTGVSPSATYTLLPPNDTVAAFGASLARP